MSLPPEPLRLSLGGYDVEVARRVDGGVTITVRVLFGSTVVPVPLDDWRRIVEYAPPPPREET